MDQKLKDKIEVLWPELSLLPAQEDMIQQVHDETIVTLPSRLEAELAVELLCERVGVPARVFSPPQTNPDGTPNTQSGRVESRNQEQLARMRERMAETIIKPAAEKALDEV